MECTYLVLNRKSGGYSPNPAVQQQYRNSTTQGRRDLGSAVEDVELTPKSLF